MNMKIFETYHMNISKDYLIEILQTHDNTKDKIYSINKKFVTSEKAVESIRQSPNEVFIIGDCNNHDSHGYCKGHKVKVKKARK